MAQIAEEDTRDVNLLHNQYTVDNFCNQNLVKEFNPSMQKKILQTRARYKQTNHEAKVWNYGKYGLKVKAWQTFLVLPKSKIILSNFSGVQRVYINTIQNIRYHNNTNG